MGTLRSMTGYGRGRAPAAGGRSLWVEARSRNHRHLELVLRLPAEYAALEDRLRALVAARVQRGRLEVSVVGDPMHPSTWPQVDLRAARAYHEVLRDLAERLGLPLGLDAAGLAALPGVSVLREAPPAAEAVEGDWPALEAAAVQALSGLDAARGREGEALAEAIRAALAATADCLRAVEARVPAVAAARQAAARARLAELLGPEGAPLAGAAVAAILDRLDVQEEIVRLHSHLRQAAEALGEPAPGRRLDFLAQEMQREWNTIAAKASDAEVAQQTVAARVAVERVREQVANVE